MPSGLIATDSDTYETGNRLQFERTLSMAIESQRQALRNLALSVDIIAKIPFRVFASEYTDIYVMDFERLVRQNTVDLLKALIALEGSSVATIARFEDVGKETQDWRDDVFFVSASTTADAYWSFIRRNTAEFGQKRATPGMRAPWLIFAERLGACSDLGNWCIYGEKFAEIALLGFKRVAGMSVPKHLQADFGIERLGEALKRETFFGDPGNEYSKEQRAILRAAYLS
ncbi:MAG: hypothetical protein ACYCOU_12120 [Sulfobacillus sp.]